MSAGSKKAEERSTDFEQHPYQAGNSLNAGGINYGLLRQQEAMKRLKELEKENGRLKRLLAEAELDKAILKEAASGKY